MVHASKETLPGGISSVDPNEATPATGSGVAASSDHSPGHEKREAEPIGEGQEHNVTFDCAGSEASDEKENEMAHLSLEEMEAKMAKIEEMETKLNDYLKDQRANQNETQLIFVYGTLMRNEVVQELLGTLPIKDMAVLHNYRRVCIEDQVFPAIVEEPEGLVVGQLMRVTPAQLALLNYFEDDDYELINVEVHCTFDQSVKSALCYLWKEEYRHLLRFEEWDEEAFIREHLPSYLVMCSEVRVEYTWQKERHVEFEEVDIRAIAEDLPMMTHQRYPGLAPTTVFAEEKVESTKEDSCPQG